MPSANNSRPVIVRQESRRPAFPLLSLAVHPTVSSGLPFDQLCLNNVSLRYNRKRAYILAEAPVVDGPIQIPAIVRRLHATLGPFVCGTWYAMGLGDWFEAQLVVEEMRMHDADVLIALGSDAIIDLAKVVLYAHSRLIETEKDHMTALMRPSDAEMSKSNGERLEREEQGHRAHVDLVCIPTTCGGAAFTHRAFGYNEAAEKFCTLVRTINYPMLIILDGEATMSAPANEWFAKGVEAINHAVEGILSINTTPHVKATLTLALRHLCEGLLVTKARPDNIQARRMTLSGANMAMTPLATVPEVAWGATHAFCDAGRRLFLTAPGDMAAVMLPVVLEWSLRAIRCDSEAAARHKMRGQHNELATALWGVPVCRQLFEQQLGLESRGSSPIRLLLRAVFDALGMPDSLAALGVGSQEQRERLAVQVVAEPAALTAPVRLTHPNHARHIINQVGSPPGQKTVH